MLHIQHTQKVFGHMEAHTIAMFKSCALAYFLVGKPSPVGKGKFKFIAVIIRVGAAYHFGHLWKIKFANARKSIFNYLPFKFKLLGIIDMLPLTATANSKMR